MKKFLALLMALVLLTPQAAFARAEIMLIPTRVVLDKGDRFATIIIRNTGDATGNLSIDLIDMTMNEVGRVMQVEEGKSDPYSAIPILRISPHSVSLKPGESQNVRILLRKPEGLADGEYRSHLKVKVEDDNVEATNEQKQGDNKAVSVEVKAKLALTIPVIVRNGNTSVAIKIDQPKLTKDPQGKPMLEMMLQREGNRSVMGDFAINYSSGGAPKEAKIFPGIPVYRGTDHRQVLIPLDDLPAGVDLTKGKFDIVYTAQPKEGGMKLAEASLNLGQ